MYKTCAFCEVINFVCKIEKNLKCWPSFSFSLQVPLFMFCYDMEVDNGLTFL